MRRLLIAAAVLMSPCVPAALAEADAPKTPAAPSAPATQPAASEMTDDAVLAAKPDPKLSAEEVVLAQLEGLRRNARFGKNAGIAVCFRFASPGNQEQTGPVEKFATLFANEAYGPLLDHKSVIVLDADGDGDAAMVTVAVRTKEGKLVYYGFTLSRQRGGPFDNCWMTDGVVPIAPPKKQMA